MGGGCGRPALRRTKVLNFPLFPIAPPYWLARRAWVGEEDVLFFLGKPLSKTPDSKNNPVKTENALMKRR